MSIPNLRAIRDWCISKFQTKGDYATDEELREVKDKLSGISEGAEVNIIESVSVNGTTVPISEEKNVNLEVLVAADLANYYTAEQVDQKLSTIPKFNIEVVQTLPTSDISSTTVYLVPSGSESQNMYTEYIYVNGTWEKLGTQKVDLSGYLTKEEGIVGVQAKSEKVITFTRGDNTSFDITIIGTTYTPGRQIQISDDRTIRLADYCTTVTNWNNVTKNGWYMSTYAAENSPPVSTGWFYGIVNAHNEDYIRQILYCFGSGNNVTAAYSDRYERIKHNGTWGEWVNTSYRNLLPRTGGDVTGNIVLNGAFSNVQFKGFAESGGNAKGISFWNADDTNAGGIGALADKGIIQGLYLALDSSSWDASKGLYITKDNITWKKSKLITEENYTDYISGANVYKIADCITEADEQVKVINISGFELKDGVTIRVRFNLGNTAVAPRLNVSNTGVKQMVYYKEDAGGYSTLNPDMLKIGYIYTFIYLEMGGQGYWYLDTNSSVVKELNDKFGGMTFGIDENGNYGYIKAGADTVTPFRTGENKLDLSCSCSVDYLQINKTMNSNSIYNIQNPKKMVLKKLSGKVYCANGTAFQPLKFQVYGIKKGATYESMIYQQLIYSVASASASDLTMVENKEIDLSEYETLTKCRFISSGSDTYYVKFNATANFEIYL